MRIPLVIVGEADVAAGTGESSRGKTTVFFEDVLPCNRTLVDFAGGDKTLVLTLNLRSC